MNFIDCIRRVVMLIGMLIIAVSITRVVAVHQVFNNLSLVIDKRMEYNYTNGVKDSYNELVDDLSLYGRGIAKFEHLDITWLHWHVLVGLTLLLPWCVIVRRVDL